MTRKPDRPGREASASLSFRFGTALSTRNRHRAGIMPPMIASNKVFLVGPMGAGKTTIGRQLAQSLRLSFLDSDHELQRRTGVDIPTIFEFEGEAGFRLREKNLIDELTQRKRIVLATGGGSVLDRESRQRLAARGTVVYLHCSPQQQYERTMKDKNRPLLQLENPLARLQALMEEREPLYREIADIIVSTENRPMQSVARDIVSRLTPRSGGASGSNNP